MDIVVSGSLAYDRIMNFRGVFGEHILPGARRFNLSFYTDTLTESFGGTAGNIAYALALLGDHATVLATAGNDFDPYRSWLDDHGVDTSSIRIDESEKTAFATIISDRQDDQIAAFYPGAMQTPWHRDHEAFAGTDFAIVSPGNPGDMKTLPAALRHENVPFLFDPGQQIPVLSAEDLKNGIDGSAVFIANDYESKLVAEKTKWNEDDLLAHTGIIVTTLGEMGSRIATKDGLIEIPAVKAGFVKDPTGAGDAYRAGFVHALLSEWPLETCGRFAALIATYAVEAKGTQTHSFTRGDLEKRYRENFNETLPIPTI